jgi:hypothetical protein
MSVLSPSTEVNSLHNNLDDNYFTFASTYKYGKIGTKKVSEESFKSNSITGNKIIIQSNPINNITNSNTNNTNSNTNSNTNNNITNSNTNNNRSKNRDIQTCKKKLKNYHSVSPNIILVQSSSNSKFYKNKQTKRLSKITKNNLKTSITHIKLSKKEFSKSSSNFHVFTNINKNKNIKYLKKKSYSKKKIKSKSLNKFTKGRKELNYTNGSIKPRFNYSSCLFSSMTSNLINRQKNKYSISSKVIKDINNNINSYKRDLSNIYKNKKNLSTNELNLNSMKYILNEDINDDSNNINISKKYNNKDESKVEENHRQITEENVNYLRVRKRSDLQNNHNLHNKEILKIESTPLISNNTKIKLSSPSSFIFNDTSAKNINSKNINLTENIKNNTYLNANNSNEECVFNIIEYQKIPKLNFENEIKSHNSNDLLPDKVKNQINKQNSIIDINDNNENYNHFNININISQSNNKNESEISEKNKDKDIKNKQEKKSIKKYNTNKNNTNNVYNTKKSLVKKNEFTKSKTNDSAFIPFKNNNNITYISNLNIIKKIKTEEKAKKFNVNKNTRNKKKYYSNSKNEFGNKTRKNYSLNNNKIHLSKKKYQINIKKQYSNRNKSIKNKSYNNKMALNKKINKNNKIDSQTKVKEKEKEKKEPFDIESPEELHYFMVNLSIQYKHLNDNF